MADQAAHENGDVIGYVVDVYQTLTDIFLLSPSGSTLYKEVLVARSPNDPLHGND